MQDISLRAPLSPWHVLLAGSLLLLILEVVGIYTAVKLGGLAVFFIMLFGGAIVAGITSRWLAAWAGVVYGIAFLLSVILGFGNAATPIWQSFVGEESITNTPVSVERAHELSASIYQFSDGSVLNALVGYHTTTGYIATRTGSRGYWAKTQRVVAPLVSASWRPEDPITVWVVCSDTWNTTDEVVDTWKCEQDWKKEWRAGVRIASDTMTEVSEAIADATSTHNLRSHPQPLVVEWTEDAQSAQRASQGFGSMLLILAHISYIGAVLWNWRKIRSTAPPQDTPPLT